MSHLLFKTLLIRDCQKLWRSPETTGRFLMMQCLSTLLFIFLGPSSEGILLGFFWSFLLLLSLAQADDLLRDDQQEGLLTFLTVHHLSLLQYTAVKTFIHWTQTGLLFLLFFPCVSLTLGLTPSSILLGKLAMSTWLLSLFGTLGACLTFGTQVRFISFMVLTPFLIPTFLFTIYDTPVSLYFLGGLCSGCTPLIFWINSKLLHTHLTQ